VASVGVALMAASSSLRAHALRLRPGQDLHKELAAFIETNQFTAVGVVTCVGSLTQVTLRYANQKTPAIQRGHFEIVSLVGTLERGGGHLHLSVSDGEGRTSGGHLLEGCLIYTTAEIILVELNELTFSRETDPTFGYKELVVRQTRK
jgi:uncharacterized protein